MRFKKLINKQWSKIQHYLLKRAVLEDQADDKTTINGIVYWRPQVMYEELCLRVRSKSIIHQILRPMSNSHQLSL